jgi:pyruvate,water dikinase
MEMDPFSADTAGSSAGDALTRFQERLDDEMCTWPSEPALHTRANAVDQWPKPITALTQDLVALPQERGLGVAFAEVLGVAEDHGPWTWNGVFYGWYTYAVEPAAAMADNLPGWSRAAVYGDYFGVEEDPSAQAGSGSSGGANPLELARIGRNFAQALRGYPAQSRAYRDEAAARLRIDLARDWSAEPDWALRQRLLAHHDEAVRYRVPHVLASVISAALFKKLNETAAPLIADGPEALVTQAVTGVGGIHLREATSAMGEVAHGTRTREQFLEEFGFRGFNEFELSARPWLDDPAALDRLIAASGGTDRGADTAAQRAEARARLRKAASWRWPLVDRLLRMTENHMRWRENGKVPMAIATHSIRLVVRESARRLAERGRLASPDDVYHLRLTELVDELAGRPVAELATAVKRRRAGLELAADLPLPEMLDVRPGRLTTISAARWRALGVLPPPEVDADGARLAGVGGSAGRCTGRARIVWDPDEVELCDGDVIIARGTDSAWTVLFYQAGAVVVDVGGPMSHSAIAAREIGIPCVLNVKDGTTRIQEGQRITVDGDAGVVLLH